MWQVGDFRKQIVVVPAPQRAPFLVPLFTDFKGMPLAGHIYAAQIIVVRTIVPDPSRIFKLQPLQIGGFRALEIGDVQNERPDKEKGDSEAKQNACSSADLLQERCVWLNQQYE